MFSEKLIKSKERVQKHGEVFTPSWMVQKMLDTEGIREDCENIYATFLEPSAGDGNFLVALLERKLEAVTQQFDKSNWKTKSLFALSSIYGIEFLEDNLELARFKMLSNYMEWYEKVFDERLSVKTGSYKSAKFIIRKNIIRGNALTKKHPDTDEPLVFSEWKRVKGKSSKVEWSEFTFVSLFGGQVNIERGIPEGQLSLFDLDGDGIDDITVKENSKPVIIDIQKAYQLEEK
ncbi:DNA methyltransferase family protein [Lactococcus kimchii]|uniref:methylase n=1 Tax=Lactococcus sp. S-13 TaxID=2507158 RepID=UPI001022A2D9|nr:methylase [Lactococcus sp. S-13]RZI48558.1 methylase [Lactococcus sp. S-13]